MKTLKSLTSLNFLNFFSWNLKFKVKKVKVKTLTKKSKASLQIENDLNTVFETDHSFIHSFIMRRKKPSLS